MNFFKRYGMIGGAIAICFFVVLYVFFTTYSIFTVNNQVNYVAEHPYKVVSEINKIRTRILEINTYLPIFLANNENRPESIKAVLHTSRQENEKSQSILQAIYLGNPEDLTELKTALKNLEQAQIQVVDIIENNAMNKAEFEKYFKKEVEPLRVKADAAIQKVIDSADRRVLIIQEATEKKAEKASIYAALMGLLMIIFIIYAYKLRNEYMVNSELKRQQQILQDALLAAGKANAAKRDFLSKMSHEIRTPMNAIIGMSAIGFNYLDDQKRIADCLSKITFSSKHLLMLINDILDMSKIEDGKFTISAELFDMKKLVTSLTDINYTLAKTKGVSFEVVLSGIEEELLIGDAMRVNQILINLLSNAIKFTPKGGSVRLEIKKIRATGTKIWLRFIVQDNGIGMKSEFLERIYEPFEQGDSSVSGKYGGTGLGMAITKNLVNIMNGIIKVESREGQGSTFTVDLPFGLNPSEHKKNSPGLEDISVLVVDDDHDTCEHAEVLLKGMGVEVDWVLNGFEAVEKARTACEIKHRCYDVCFIDWCMPDMDGIETTRLIRDYAGPDALIIIISAYDWSDIEQQAREAGVNAFIAKPFFASTLYNTLLTVIRKDGAVIPEEIGSTKDKYDFQGQKVLLVEDNELNMEIAAELLKFANLQVDVAENGQVAVDLFVNSKAKEYALIFMDIQMPEMNGYDATRCIRASKHTDAQEIPIIAMTANAFRDDVQAALDAGMNGHLAKPIDVNTIYEMIAKHINF